MTLIANLDGAGNQVTLLPSNYYTKKQIDNLLPTYFVKYYNPLTDYTDAIQDAIDNHDNIIIGSSPSEIFLISKPLILRSNIKIQIEGTIKMSDAVSSLLAVNAAEGASSITVVDVSGFQVDQWISTTDDDQPAVGGGAGHTRKEGYVSKITSIVGNVISLADPVYTDAGTGFLVASNAITGTYNSIFIGEGVDNIFICGCGILDGNKANQTDNGANNPTGMEEVRSGNAISLKNCSNINFRDFTIKDCILHDITTWLTEDLSAIGVKLYSATDKNWLLYDCNDFIIADCIFNDADYEDGLCLYYGNERMNISNCVAINNGRMGIGLNSTNNNIQVVNCYSEDNGLNLYVGLSYNCTITGFISKDGGQIRHNPTSMYNPVKINESNNITINGLIADGMIDYSEAHYQVLIQGDCDYIIFNGGVFCNTDHVTTANGYGFGLIASGGNTPANLYLNGVVFHNLKLAVALINDSVDRVVFRDCIFYDNTTIGTIRDSAKFYNCRGLVLQETGTVTFTAALVLKYGSTHAGDYVYPVKERFRFWFLEPSGNSKVIWCDWVSSNDYPNNNFRVNVDAAPGVEVDIGWEYDHNIRV